MIFSVVRRYRCSKARPTSRQAGTNDTKRVKYIRLLVKPLHRAGRNINSGVNQQSKRILGDIDKSHPVLVDAFDNTVFFRNETAVEPKLKNKEKKTTS